MGGRPELVGGGLTRGFGDGMKSKKAGSAGPGLSLGF